MKEKKYLETKESIIKYLKKKECFCFRKNIILDLVSKGHKKTNVILTLRLMKKQGKIKRGWRRWGL